MFKKDKLPLLVGIGLPIVLIMYIAFTSYIPSLFTKPKYNFLYYSGYQYDYDIQILNGQLNVTPKYTNDPSRPIPQAPTINFYRYDSLADKSTAISLQQAQNYILDPSNKSSDGYQVGKVETSYSVFPLLFGGYDRGIYMTGHGLNRKIGDNDYDFKFLGWITNE